MHRVPIRLFVSERRRQPVFSSQEKQLSDQLDASLNINFRLSVNRRCAEVFIYDTAWGMHGSIQCWVIYCRYNLGYPASPCQILSVTVVKHEVTGSCIVHQWACWTWASRPEERPASSQWAEGSKQWFILLVFCFLTQVCVAGNKKRERKIKNPGQCGSRSKQNSLPLTADKVELLIFTFC